MSVVDGQHTPKAPSLRLSSTMRGSWARCCATVTPDIRYRGQLLVSDGRELPSLRGVIAWSDGRRVNIGPFLSRAALIEAIHLGPTQAGGNNRSPWL
jgi:hypothetical protein